MPLNQEYLEELSDRLVLDLRHSSSYQQLTNEQKAELENRLSREAIRGAYPLLPGASEEDLAEFSEALFARFEIRPPESLLNVLRIIDGFIENGVVLYGIDHELREDGFDSGPGIIEETANLWASLGGAQSRYLFLGDSDLWWFVFDLELQSYLVLSKSAFQPVFKFADAAEMVNDMLRQALNDFEQEAPEQMKDFSLN
jgi:hypothetical protein